MRIIVHALNNPYDVADLNHVITGMETLGIHFVEINPSPAAIKIAEYGYSLALGLYENPQQKRYFELMLAVANNDYNAVCLFIQNGYATLPEKDHVMDTPFHVAARTGNLHMMRLLMTAPDANLCYTNKDGETALHIAVQDKRDWNTNLVEYLIEKGSNVNARDNRGRTPLDVAQANSCANAIAVLQKHGAYTGDDARNWLRVHSSIGLFSRPQKFHHGIIKQEQENEKVNTPRLMIR